MLIVGTDRMRVVGSSAAPEGPWHAVDATGRVLCRTNRPRYTWPALSWEEHRGQQAECMLCAQVRNAQEALSQVPAYPVGPQMPAAATSPLSTAPLSTELVPWQPSVGLFESDAS